MSIRTSNAASMMGTAFTLLVLAGGAPSTRGGGTVMDESRNAFSNPMPEASDEHLATFYVGNSFFKRNWVEAPGATTARDGLGPLFNARACSACHLLDGRALAPATGSESLRDFPGLVLRISLPGKGLQGEPLPHPAYGDQVNQEAIPGVPPEAEVRVDYDIVRGWYPDGTPYELRSPRYRILNQAYGPVGADTLISPRLAPQLGGLGLLESVPESSLHALALRQRGHGGPKGRLNRVWDPATKKMVVGRFGWKAEAGSLLQQSAAAFNADIGITSRVFPIQNCTRVQRECGSAPDGASPEINDRLLDSVVLYTRLLAAPAPRNTDDPEVTRGRQRFAAAGCAICHVPRLRTGEVAGFPELSNVEFEPYTDLLLHDMGPGLADHRPVFKAGARHWRTPPLWGIGLLETVGGRAAFLHDGRARTLEEAILWHAGEAGSAREKFRALTSEDRRALLAFLESL